MPEHLRIGLNGPRGGRPAAHRRIFTEALNPYFGYYYTVKKTVRTARTGHQRIELVDTDEFGRVLLLDGITQVAEHGDFQYHEPIVHPALCSHPCPGRIAVVGGGDGGVLREVLKYPAVKRVDLAELDKQVIDFSKKYLGHVHKGSFDDPRVNIHVTDGRSFIERNRGRFDVVIMDMTDPFGPSKMLYTREFYRNVKHSFRNGQGLFVMHSESPVSRPSTFACIQRTLGSVFGAVRPFYIYIQMYAVLWSITVSANSNYVSEMKPETIDSRLRRYGIRDLHVYEGATHEAMQAAFPYIKRILTGRARIITDKKPDFPDKIVP